MFLLFILSCLAALSGVYGGPYDTVEAALGDIPYMAAVYDVIDYPIANVFKREFRCTSAILDSEHVLTTATCVKTVGFSGWIAVAPGLLNRTDSEATFLNVTDTLTHEQYDFWSKDNDIAIMKVSPKFTWSSAISPINVRTSLAPSGTSCRISGWRRDMVLAESMLRYGNASVFEQNDCFYLFGKVGFLCGGVPKEEKCGCLLGDEGAPLVCEGQLSGLFLYNMNTCFDPPQPGTFTDIVYHKDWIQQSLQKLRDL